MESSSKSVSPIGPGPLQRQIAVKDSMLPSFNGGPVQPPVSFYLPPRIKMSPRSSNSDQLQREFQQQTELPPRLSPSRRSAQAVSIFEPFRNHVHTTESGHTTLDLDDGTIIDMGNVDINKALGMLRRLTDSNGNVTYKVDGFTPEIEMIILPDGRILLRPPPALILPPMSEQTDKFIRRKKQLGGRRRTRARKMGRNGTNKRHRRRRCMNHTRRKSLFIFRRR